MKTISDQHLFRLTDDTGIFQHTRFAVPDYQHGYTTDDNARALIVAVKLYELTGEEKYIELMYKYLSFLHYALTEQGKFKNFMDFQRKFIEEEGSEDCFGRCVWAIATVLSSPKLPQNTKRIANYLLGKMEQNLNKLTFLRAKAYTLLGICLLKNEKYTSRIQVLVDDFKKAYAHHKCNEWHWFENEMTYSNAIIPGALFLAAQNLNQPDVLELAKESFCFLLKQTVHEGSFKAIGCMGWYKKDEKRAEFDEQPIEAGETVYVCDIAYQVTKKLEYLHYLQLVCDWFYGKNCLKQSMIDPETKGCFDGITSEGVNLNQGSESIISLLLAETTAQKNMISMKIQRVSHS